MNNSILPSVLLGAAVLTLAPAGPAHAQATGADDRSGLRCISSKPFPLQAGSAVIPLPGADFENTDGKSPAGWGMGGQIVTAPDAPEGKSYFTMKSPGGGLNGPVIPAEAGRGYLVSFWVKTAHDPWLTIVFSADEREPSFSDIHTPLCYPNFPLDTGGQWRREGFYFLMPPQCKTMQFSFGTRDVPAGQTVALDDIELRSVSDSELSAAYDAERAHYPAYDPSPAPGDGKNLALSVAKWEGCAGLPGKPFVIWALGSSFTDRLGDGYDLVRDIRKRFPNAPPIIYRKHGGPGCPWEFVYCWVKQFIATEQPDLILTYTSGTKEGLEELLNEVRTRTTAEVIVPSLHFRPPPPTITPENITSGMLGYAWDDVRQICEKYGAEYVDNRAEMADYLAKTGLDQEALLLDHNHENVHGAIRVWDNIARHLTKSDQSTYTPESRERRIPVDPPANTKTEKVALSGGWTASGGTLRSSAAGADLKASFTGNEIDLLGRSLPSGGTLKVLVDGVPADQAPVFVTDYIKPKPNNWRVPHAIDLGSNLAPQTWTITMTDGAGDFRVDGSVAGADGTGNLEQPFTSHSGQIIMDPKLWRAGVRRKAGAPPDYGVNTGDTFTFHVLRATNGQFSFKADKPAPLVQRLVYNLPNGPHTIELITTGDGDVTIDGLYVFQPPGDS
jgi:hypothetical protein